MAHPVLAGSAMIAGADASIGRNWTGSLRDSEPSDGRGGLGSRATHDVRPVDQLAFTAGGSSDYRKQNQHEKSVAAAAASHRRRRAWESIPLPVDTRHGDLSVEPPPLANVESPSKAKVKPTRRASFTASGQRRFTVGNDMKSLRGQLEETQQQLQQTRATQASLHEQNSFLLHRLHAIQKNTAENTASGQAMVDELLTDLSVWQSKREQLMDQVLADENQRAKLNATLQSKMELEMSVVEAQQIKKTMEDTIAQLRTESTALEERNKNIVRSLTQTQAKARSIEAHHALVAVETEALKRWPKGSRGKRHAWQLLRAAVVRSQAFDALVDRREQRESGALMRLCLARWGSYVHRRRLMHRCTIRSMMGLQVDVFHAYRELVARRKHERDVAQVVSLQHVQKQQRQVLAAWTESLATQRHKRATMITRARYAHAWQKWEHGCEQVRREEADMMAKSIKAMGHWLKRILYCWSETVRKMAELREDKVQQHLGFHFFNVLFNHFRGWRDATWSGIHYRRAAAHRAITLWHRRYHQRSFVDHCADAHNARMRVRSAILKMRLWAREKAERRKRMEVLLRAMHISNHYQTSMQRAILQWRQGQMAERKWRTMNSVAEQHYAAALYRMCFGAWSNMHDTELRIRAFRRHWDLSRATQRLASGVGIPLPIRPLGLGSDVLLSGHAPSGSQLGLRSVEVATAAALRRRRAGMVQGRKALLEGGPGNGKGARNGYLNRFGGSSGGSGRGGDPDSEGGYFSLTEDEEEMTVAASPKARGRSRDKSVESDSTEAGRQERSQSPSRPHSRLHSRSHSRSATSSPLRNGARGESVGRWNGSHMRDANIFSSTSYADMYSMGGRAAALREARRIATSDGYHQRQKMRTALAHWSKKTNRMARLSRASEAVQARHDVSVKRRSLWQWTVEWMRSTKLGIERQQEDERKLVRLDEQVATMSDNQTKLEERRELLATQEGELKLLLESREEERRLAEEANMKAKEDSLEAENVIAELNDEQALASDEHRRLSALAAIMAEEEAQAARIAAEQRSRRLAKLAALQAERREVEQMLESANAEAIVAENELRVGNSEVDAKYREAHAITVQYQQLLDQRTNAIAALAKERDEARAQLRAARLALIDGVEVDAATMAAIGEQTHANAEHAAMEAKRASMEAELGNSPTQSRTQSPARIAYKSMMGDDGNTAANAARGVGSWDEPSPADSNAGVDDNGGGDDGGDAIERAIRNEKAEQQVLRRRLTQVEARANELLAMVGEREDEVEMITAELRAQEIADKAPAQREPTVSGLADPTLDMEFELDGTPRVKPNRTAVEAPRRMRVDKVGGGGREGDSRTTSRQGVKVREGTGEKTGTSLGRTDRNDPLMATSQRKGIVAGVMGRPRARSGANPSPPPGEPTATALEVAKPKATGLKVPQARNTDRDTRLAMRSNKGRSAAGGGDVAPSNGDGTDVFFGGLQSDIHDLQARILKRLQIEGDGGRDFSGDEGEGAN